ncbi:MAG TPA: hypothetical protein VGN17_23150 [Bryobacteraceae bacterium]
MSLNEMISELRAELAAVDQAIAAVARIAQSQRKPRGRPPAWMAARAPASDASMMEVPRRRGRPRKS